MGWMTIYWIVLIIALVWLLTRAGHDECAARPTAPRVSGRDLETALCECEISPDDYKRMLNEIRR